MVFDDDVKLCKKRKKLWMSLLPFCDTYTSEIALCNNFVKEHWSFFLGGGGGGNHKSSLFRLKII